MGRGGVARGSSGVGNGWMDGWMDGWVAGWLGRCWGLNLDMGGRMSGWMGCGRDGVDTETAKMKNANKTYIEHCM